MMYGIIGNEKDVNVNDSVMIDPTPISVMLDALATPHFALDALHGVQQAQPESLRRLVFRATHPIAHHGVQEIFALEAPGWGLNDAG